MKLEKAIKFKNGKKRNSEVGDIPVYGGNGILGYTNIYNAEKNNIIIGRVGAYCGCVYKNDNKCWISDNAIVGNVKEGYDYNYMYYLLKNMNLNYLHIGSSHPLMTQDILNNIEISIPDYQYQQRAAKILNSIDNKIELNSQINDNLQKLGYKLISNELQQKPKKELRKVIRFIKGKKPLHISKNKKKNYLPYLTIANLNNQEDLYANKEKTIVANNELLMVMDGASSGDVYYSDYGVVGSTLAKVQILDNNYNQAVIYFILKYFSDYIKSKNTGSAIPHTDKEIIYKLLIPNIEEQRIYKDILDNILKLNKQNRKLEQLRDTLLPKLMNGEIDLEKIEI